MYLPLSHLPIIEEQCKYFTWGVRWVLRAPGGRAGATRTGGTSPRTPGGPRGQSVCYWHKSSHRGLGVPPGRLGGPCSPCCTLWWWGGPGPQGWASPATRQRPTSGVTCKQAKYLDKLRDEKGYTTKLLHKKSILIGFLQLSSFYKWIILQTKNKFGNLFFSWP